MKHVVNFLLAVAVLLCISTAALAGEPTEAIRDAVNQGIEILNSAKLDNEKQRGQIIDRLRQVVYPLFDFREMAMRSLRPELAAAGSTAAQRICHRIHRTAGKTYANQIDLYHGQKFAYKGETIDGTYAEVDTRILDKMGRPTP